MRRRSRPERETLARFAIAAALVASASCSETVIRKSDPGAADGGDDAAAAFSAGEELQVPVAEGERVFVSLASPPRVASVADPRSDRSWDLAFEGLEVYTNSGPSGPGAGSAFGPLDPVVLLDDRAPAVPFSSGDRTGGAFLRWYLYEGPPNHALYSRFHVYGVKDGDAIYAVQVLSYYGKDGAPALYSIRYAAAGQPPKEATELDGTATGDGKGACIDLGTGARTMLTPAEARTSTAWHLCFRRQDISVNGEEGGPRGVGAVDLDADAVASETIEVVAERTAASELARFSSVTPASFEGRTFRGDRVVSAFSGVWTAPGSAPPAPARHAWLVVGADGKTRYLVGFPRFDAATATTPGTVVMRVKAAR